MDDVDIMSNDKRDDDVPPRCYGMMIWILEYPVDEMHEKVTCDCEHKDHCFELTKKKGQTRPEAIRRFAFDQSDAPVVPD